MKAITVIQTVWSAVDETREDLVESDTWVELGLRDAVKAARGTRTNEVDGASYHSLTWNKSGGRLVYFVSNPREFRTGDVEERSVHLHGVTQASAKRLAKLFDVPLDSHP